MKISTNELKRLLLESTQDEFKEIVKQAYPGTNRKTRKMIVDLYTAEGWYPEDVDELKEDLPDLINARCEPAKAKYLTNAIEGENNEDEHGGYGVFLRGELKAKFKTWDAADEWANKNYDPDVYGDDVTIDPLTSDEAEEDIVEIGDAEDVSEGLGSTLIGGALGGAIGGYVGHKFGSKFVKNHPRASKWTIGKDNVVKVAAAGAGTIGALGGAVIGNAVGDEIEKRKLRKHKEEDEVEDILRQNGNGDNRDSNDSEKDEDNEERSKKAVNESVSWHDFNKFDKILSDYLPTTGEGDTMANQIATAICKIVYRWFNDGDVYDNTTNGINTYNDLSDYANWLYKYVPEADRVAEIVDYDGVSNFDDFYAELLYGLCTDLTDVIEEYAAEPKTGSVYNCEGPFKCVEDEDEESGDELYQEADNFARTKKYGKKGLKYGALAGAALGGLAGGTLNDMTGSEFLPGAAIGAAGGAVGGAMLGGTMGAGAGLVGNGVNSDKKDKKSNKNSSSQDDDEDTDEDTNDTNKNDKVKKGLMIGAGLGTIYGATSGKGVIPSAALGAGIGALGGMISK